MLRTAVAQLQAAIEKARIAPPADDAGFDGRISELYRSLASEDDVEAINARIAVAAELRRLYALIRRYAHTDGDARSTDELLAFLSNDENVSLTHFNGAWSCYVGAIHTIAEGDGPTARAALQKALAEREATP
jgi:hypothetical protein